MTKIILVGCGKAKAPTARPARELYTGCLFRAARRYAEASGLPWLILSAKYGAVLPDTVLAPYDEKLSVATLAETKKDRPAWWQLVLGQLQAAFPGQALHCTVLAGGLYLIPIEERAPMSWYFDAPLTGMAIGERLRWFKQQRPGRSR